MSQANLKVGIVGATGYTGVELLRLLLQHPTVSVTAVTSRAESGRSIAELWPSLRAHSELVFTEPDAEALASRCDLVFFATPHAVAMHTVPALLEQGVRVIDLSADFRLKALDVWESWYGCEHACPELIDEAVYGLPEIFGDELLGAQLVACPGCYPTAIQLGFAPLPSCTIHRSISLSFE